MSTRGLVAAVAIWLIMVPIFASRGIAEIIYQNQSNTLVSGRDRELGVQLLARSVSPQVTQVVVSFPGEKKVEVVIDRAAGSLSMKSFWASNGEIAKLDIYDIMTAYFLTEGMGQPASDLEETILSTLNMLSDARAGIALSNVVRLESAKVSDNKSITSLCGRAGAQVDATYDTKQGSITEKILMGPCYNQGNDCLGRCGLGCGVPGSKLVQQFTQDCLNHDVCRLRTGANTQPPCDDEFFAASDDFFAASDCGSFNGKWRDEHQLLWKVSQDRLGSIVGSVETGAKCGRYTVRGQHLDSRITNLTAVRLFPPAGCCRSFTYKGNYSGCGRVKGTWTNQCTLSGSFTLTRAQSKQLEEEGTSTLGPAPFQD